MRRSDEVDHGNVMNVALYHRKVNEGPKHSPMGFEITFDNKNRAVHFGSLDVGDDSSLSAHTSLSYRVRGALRKGKMTTATLAEHLDVSEKVLRVTLGRMSDVTKIGDSGGRGNVALWGLAQVNDDDVPF
jgi:hypothetical protein